MLSICYVVCCVWCGDYHHNWSPGRNFDQSSHLLIGRVLFLKIWKWVLIPMCLNYKYIYYICDTSFINLFKFYFDSMERVIHCNVFFLDHSVVLKRKNIYISSCIIFLYLSIIFGKENYGIAKIWSASQFSQFSGRICCHNIVSIIFSFGILICTILMITVI